MKIKKVIITGGAGFIGSHLCKKILNEGHKVICVDNLFTGSKYNIKETRLARLSTAIAHSISKINLLFM